MKRLTAITISLGAIALATAAVAMPSIASAQTPPESTPAAGARARGPLERLRDRPRPAAVAVAFGRLVGAEAAVIDFRAAEGAQRSGGHLRFWSATGGFYNGVSRNVEINGQNAHAEGVGALLKPDGTKVRVRFTLDLNGETSRITIAVRGEGIEYTLAGTVEGRVFVGAPPSAG